MSNTKKIYLRKSALSILTDEEIECKKYVAEKIRVLKEKYPEQCKLLGEFNKSIGAEVDMHTEMIRFKNHKIRETHNL